MIQKMPRDYFLCVVVHNSTYVSFTDSFMLSDPWNPMEISWAHSKTGEKMLQEKYAGNKSGIHKYFCHRVTAWGWSYTCKTLVMKKVQMGT